MLITSVFFNTVCLRQNDMPITAAFSADDHFQMFATSTGYEQELCTSPFPIGLIPPIFGKSSKRLSATEIRPLIAIFFAKHADLLCILYKFLSNTACGFSSLLQNLIFLLRIR